MKKAIYISILLCFGFKCVDSNCELKNGKYKVIYDKEFTSYPKFEFEINEQYLTELNSDLIKKYKIEYIGEKSFTLISVEKQRDSLTVFQKKLTSNTPPYYEILGCKKDSIYFILRVNLHVISHSGKFVKMK